MQAERLTTDSGTTLSGPLLITPRVFGDDRGFFLESWNQTAFAAALEADGQPVPVGNGSLVPGCHRTILTGHLSRCQPR